MYRSNAQHTGSILHNISLCVFHSQIYITLASQTKETVYKILTWLQGHLHSGFVQNIALLHTYVCSTHTQSQTEKLHVENPLFSLSHTQNNHQTVQVLIPSNFFHPTPPPPPKPNQTTTKNHPTHCEATCCTSPPFSKHTTHHSILQPYRKTLSTFPCI